MTSSINPNHLMTGQDAVREVLNILTGLSLDYQPTADRYQSAVQAINRSLRATARESEWSYYSDEENLGAVRCGEQELYLRKTLRARVLDDDAARLVDCNGAPKVWAQHMQRSSLNKYRFKEGLWFSVVRNRVLFSRPILSREDGLNLIVPVMREPKMLTVNAYTPELFYDDSPMDGIYQPFYQSGDPRLADPNVVERLSSPRVPGETELGDDAEQFFEYFTPLSTSEDDLVEDETTSEYLDFDHPDLVLTRAAYMVALTDPVMQPRAQSLETEWKNIMYALVERDTRHTDAPVANDYILPLHNGLAPQAHPHLHPHSQGRW